MTEEEIKAMFEAFKTEVLEVVTEANKGVAASLQRDIKKLKSEVTKKPETTETLESPTTDPNISVLKTELDNLKAQLETEQKEKLRIQKDQTLSSLVNSKKFASPSLVKDALNARYGDNLIQQNGEWYIQRGENFTKLTDEFETFVKSPEGKSLILFEGAKGSGVTTETTRGSKPPETDTKETDPGKMLFSQFATKTQ
jgi:uncharacterized small protein (DUF1192 family)